MRVSEIPEKLPEDLEKYVKDIFKVLALSVRKKKEALSQEEHNKFDLVKEKEAEVIKA